MPLKPGKYDKRPVSYSYIWVAQVHLPQLYDSVPHWETRRHTPLIHTRLWLVVYSCC